MTDQSTESPPPLRVAALAFDSADPSALASWWAALLGGTVEVDPDGDATVHAPHAPAIDFLRVPEGRR